jgi:hypothetical protein
VVFRQGTQGAAETGFEISKAGILMLQRRVELLSVLSSRARPSRFEQLMSFYVLYLATSGMFNGL